jgi:putative membrane-bound dehydrogenase-like protein
MIRLPLAILLSSLLFAFSTVAQPANLVPANQAASRVRLPAGFKATLFAAEPDVRQPISMSFDDRGRLWVAECYTYSNAKTNFDLGRRDRIVIFEDTKGTGHFDKRTVFWDQGVRLTSIAPGFGGVFALCAPNLIFIPDRNGDDIPDGPPEILLDGWDADKVRHNIVNGLKWGPDGWLYGRHGIMATSSVGRPGTPDAERTKLNCAIWRYHPTKKTFEVFCQGTTNPWGSDWDEHGQMFFINTVIGHLWQAIPGAWYKRMYGEPLTRFRYGLIDQAADHYHWDTGKTWQQSRDSATSSDSLGGGHAHSGLMIYQGVNWPREYRGNVFTLNFHGQRINRDRLEILDSGPVGKHMPDAVFFDDPWFRGIDLDYGPDGSVYVLDWSDTGECHGADNVDISSGRIYRISYEAAPPRRNDTGQTIISKLPNNALARMTESELLKLQLSENEWLARHSRRLLQERAAAGSLGGNFKRQVLRGYDNEKNGVKKLRLLFAAHDTSVETTSWLLEQLKCEDRFIRGWAVRFLAESAAADPAVVDAFAKLARNDSAASVRLELASALQRLEIKARMSVAIPLLERAADNSDRYLPLMLWYGLEPWVARFPSNAVDVAATSRIRIVSQYVARRLADMANRRPKPMSLLLARAASFDAERQTDILRGLAESFSTAGKIEMPDEWPQLRDAATHSKSKESLRLARQIGATFSDPWAVESLKETATDKSLPADERRGALREFILSKPQNANAMLRSFLLDPVLSPVAARGLLLQDDPQVGPEVLQHWGLYDETNRTAIIALLITRASFAAALLDAIGSGMIPRSALNASQAKQILNFDNESLAKKLETAWGTIHASDADKAKAIADFRKLLTPEKLKAADLAQGRVVFNQTCAICHRLYGEGAGTGPDLTGGGRASLDYLLENVIDPSAIVPADYHVTQFEMKDDRTISGIVVSKNEIAITVQTTAEKLVLQKSAIESMRETSISLMPEGLLQSLKPGQIVNLIAYLMAPTQVALP